MGKRRISKAILYLLLLLLVLWPLTQLYDLVKGQVDKQDATHLLYQVSTFQMELLSSFFHDVDRMKSTSELDTLKQALYNASYTHERLVLAVGSKQLTALHSLSELMQYILRLQIGGQRQLKPDELQFLQEASKKYADMYAAYDKLMSSSGTIISSQNDKISKVDQSLSELLHKKLLQ